MASILGVTAIHHAPNLDMYRRTGTPATASPASSLSFADKPLLNSLKAQTSFSSGSRRNLSGLTSSAIATPNSILSEEAFRSLEGLDSLDDEFIGSEPIAFSDDSSADDDELAVSRLGLPQRLTDSLQKRGITSLFPIQVLSHTLSFFPLFSSLFYAFAIQLYSSFLRHFTVNLLI